MKWIYSEKLDLYICLDVLKADSHVMAVAKKCGICLEWDEYGNIINLEFDDAKKLASSLGMGILSPAEYWICYNELDGRGETEILRSFASDKYAEFLDRVYLRDGSYIDHPVVADKYTYEGERIYGEIPVGRPGWIRPCDIDEITAHPHKLYEKKKKTGLIKYWSPDLSVTNLDACVGIRGYVTSVDSISLDLGIPVDSRQPKLMLRLCSKDKPAESLTENELRKKEEEECYSRGLELIQKGSFGENILNYDDFRDYILSLKSRLESAACEDKQIFLVMGHRNPDSDTVVTSVIEAYRQTLTDKNPDHVYIPVVQASRLPDEIALIFGKELTPALIYETDIDIDTLLSCGLVKIIFTDQNYQREYQRYVAVVTDHHMKSNELGSDDITIPFNIRLIGSCSAIIAIKLAGSGFDPDRDISRILYSAMLMDTENRVEHKMTDIDRCVMDLMKEKSGIDDSPEYIRLMNGLIAEKDIEELFFRDYKQFFGYGFAVLKVCDFIYDKDYARNIETVKALAEEEIQRKGFDLLLFKIVEYDKNDLSVLREDLYYVFDEDTGKIVREKTVELLTKIIRLCFGNARVDVYDDHIEITGSGRQISRKKIAPAVEILLKKTSEYVYCKSISKWVSRSFLKMNDAIRKLPDSYDTDKAGRICNISYREAVELCDRLGIGMLALPEYWKVYYEMEERKDAMMQASLTDPDFIEFIGTTSDQLGDYEPASPGLISPDDIDLDTGLPRRIRKPNEYDDKSLWRYWSPPDREHVYVFSRSHIFLLAQSSLDAKTYPDEGFSNLGIRPVRDENIRFDLRITDSDGAIRIYYKSEYDDGRQLIYEAGDFIE
ncbi:MAG: hypothetical protein J5509_02675 [Lachnospiraceae bacterium]|nr:hypothetical protein [Lachnospiraceae bacterium]